MEVSDEEECFSINKIIDNIIEDFSPLSPIKKENFNEAFDTNTSDIMTANITNEEKIVKFEKSID